MHSSLTYQVRLTDSKQSLAPIDHIDPMLTSLELSDPLRVLVWASYVPLWKKMLLAICSQQHFCGDSDDSCISGRPVVSALVFYVSVLLFNRKKC